MIHRFVTGLVVALVSSPGLCAQGNAPEPSGCGYFTRPHYEYGPDGLFEGSMSRRRNVYARGSQVCFQGKMLLCVEGSWRDQGTCDSYQNWQAREACRLEDSPTELCKPGMDLTAYLAEQGRLNERNEALFWGVEPDQRFERKGNNCNAVLKQGYTLGIDCFDGDDETARTGALGPAKGSKKTHQRYGRTEHQLARMQQDHNAKQEEARRKEACEQQVTRILERQKSGLLRWIGSGSICLASWGAYLTGKYTLEAMQQGGCVRVLDPGGKGVAELQRSMRHNYGAAQDNCTRVPPSLSDG